jgi:hypothetical protein
MLSSQRRQNLKAKAKAISPFREEHHGHGSVVSGGYHTSFLHRRINLHAVLGLGLANITWNKGLSKWLE